MRFVGGTALSDNALWMLSFQLVQTHGEGARDVVATQVEAADLVGDVNEHAKWTNVCLGVLEILRPREASC